MSYTPEQYQAHLMARDHLWCDYHRQLPVVLDLRDVAEMSAPRCPKCKRLTYSPKHNSCTADGCVLNHTVSRAISVTATPRISVTPKAKRGRPSKASPLTNAQRQRAHRERAKASV